VLFQQQFVLLEQQFAMLEQKKQILPQMLEKRLLKFEKFQRHF
jgi:hypothetical protein